MVLPPFEETDLKIVEIETEEGDTNTLYFLMEAGRVAGFDANAFLASMEKIFTTETVDEAAFDELLDQFGIIELMEDEEVGELVQEGELDPEDIHQSLYDFLLEDE